MFCLFGPDSVLNREVTGFRCWFENRKCLGSYRFPFMNTPGAGVHGLAGSVFPGAAQALAPANTRVPWRPSMRSTLLQTDPACYLRHNPINVLARGVNLVRSFRYEDLRPGSLLRIPLQRTFLAPAHR
jgi:hypothetical protein